MFSKLLFVVLFAAVSVSIEGANEGSVDEPQIIDGSASVGERFKWLVPDGLTFLPTKKTKLVVVPERPGTYTITLVAVDRELNIDAATHILEVKE